ncbi:hypothetical protein E4T63_17650 [Pseudomonas fluorescens]|jgi:hypothetical protein|uniref:Uncharacterized protein n=1 Tax=Pseudomonas fluorescens TaxID=294 RepID=A0AAP8Z2V5_PSEFL|nr:MULTISPECIES: hypothetical protein [Pseudomonas]QBX42308.1 hypothetical protein E4T63_17650 [Pseudomonas fluorescens]
MKTTFETALDLHETSDFFKGNGQYFARDSDWGDHLSISNWQEICSVLKNQKAAQNLLTSIFEDYAEYLKEDYSDAEGLFSNISAYYTLKNKIAFLSSNSYDLIESLDERSKKNIGKLFRLLRQQYDLKNKDLPKYTFDEEIKRLRLKGCTLNLEQL